jgi:hypothetical protein
MERQSLVGSAYKRLALIDGVSAGRSAHVRGHLEAMREAYARALDTGRSSGETDLYYPAASCLVADVALNGGRRAWRGLDRKMLETVEDSLGARRGHDADFWSVAGEIELRQWQALARRRLASEQETLTKAYHDLHNRAKAVRMWASVYDTACLVLRGYAARASETEAKAANALLALVRDYAHPRSAV